MGSVIVTWKGRCPDRDIQNELLSSLRVLAERQEARWSRAPSPRPRFSEIIAAQRAEGAPVRPTVRFFDETLTGRILVRSDVARNRHALLEAATRRGLVYEPESSRSSHALLRLERLHVRGLDVRLFDPRALYPGEDRLSFFFLESEEAPFLNGCLAAVAERDICARSPVDVVRQADWYVECPYVHLRYYLEEWIDGLLAWIKFFFIPDLYYHRHEALSGFAVFQDALTALQEKKGYPEARALFFEGLLAGFEQEADQWTMNLESWIVPTVDSIRLVLPAWTLLFDDEQARVWQSDEGDGLSVHFHAQPPDLAASLDDLDGVRAAVRAEAAQAGAGIVEVDVIAIDSIPAVRSIIKKPQQPSGMTYEGRLMLPRRDFSFTITVLCPETGTTGLRDTAVFLRMASDYGAPGGKAEGWFQDPYDPLFEGTVLRNPSDDPEWDDRFPDHPFSRCRAHLRMVETRVSLKDDIMTAAAFTGPA